MITGKPIKFMVQGKVDAFSVSLSIASLRASLVWATLSRSLKKQRKSIKKKQTNCKKIKERQTI